MANLHGTISKLSSYYGIISFDEERKIERETYNVKRSIPFFSSDLSQYNIGDEVEFSINQPLNGNSGNIVLVRGQVVQFAINVTVVKQGVGELIDDSQDFYQLLNSKFIPSLSLTDELSVLAFLKKNHLRYSTLNEISVLFNLIDGQVEIAEFQSIIDYDKKFKEFIMKWVLFVEDDIKSRIENRISELNISESDLFNKVNSTSNNNLKNLIKKSLKSLRKNYLLRDSGD
ncbi:TPA: Abi family protein, partial [Streptococcus suis]|nr:Abi family protein [Streptococcus suis]